MLCVDAQFTREQSGALAGGGGHPEQVALGRIDVEDGRLRRDLWGLVILIRLLLEDFKKRSA